VIIPLTPIPRLGTTQCRKIDVGDTCPAGGAPAAHVVLFPDHDATGNPAPDHELVTLWNQTPPPFGRRSQIVTLNAVFAPPFENDNTHVTNPPTVVTTVGLQSFHKNTAGFATRIFAVAEYVTLVPCPPPMYVADAEFVSSVPVSRNAPAGDPSSPLTAASAVAIRTRLPICFLIPLPIRIPRFLTGSPAS
jgi:hypothetical protein